MSASRRLTKVNCLRMEFMIFVAVLLVLEEDAPGEDAPSELGPAVVGVSGYMGRLRAARDRSSGMRMAEAVRVCRRRGWCAGSLLAIVCGCRRRCVARRTKAGGRWEL